MVGSGAGLDRLGLARFGALPERPLRLLPRWLGIVLLILTGIACIANTASLQTLDKRLETLNAVRSEDGARVDMDLYRTINARVATGEDYYEVATDEHRRTNYPTSPFVTVRTPVLAWTTALWGGLDGGPSRSCCGSPISWPGTRRWRSEDRGSSGWGRQGWWRCSAWSL